MRIWVIALPFLVAVASGHVDVSFPAQADSHPDLPGALVLLPGERLPDRAPS